MTKQEMTAAILAAKAAQNFTWQRLSETVELSPVFTTSACLGENQLPAAEADRLCTALGLPAAVSTALQGIPSKGAAALAVPTDPLLYRFHEINLVYGSTIKELIEEQFGAGIMSAIDFTMDLEKVEDPKGDRVKITMCGKFLGYKRW